MFIEDLKILFSDSLNPIEKKFDVNEFVFRQGDLAEGIFAVEQGQIKLERYTSDGKIVRIHHAKAKECFAEASLFSDQYECYASVTAAAQLTMFPKKEVLRVLQDTPDTAIKYVALLSKQVKKLRTNIELLGIPSAKQRILAYLLLAADSETQILKLQFTVKDMSEQLGLAHETVYRELKNLELESVIERSETEIRLLSSQ